MSANVYCRTIAELAAVPGFHVSGLSDQGLREPGAVYNPEGLDVYEISVGVNRI
jgi:hypothetical protein